MVTESGCVDGIVGTNVDIVSTATDSDFGDDSADGWFPESVAADYDAPGGMTMIALAEAVLSEAPPSATLAIRAQCDGALTTVRIDCHAPCATEPPSVQALRARLQELYGKQVRLAFTCDAIRGRQATVEVDLAESDGDHR